MSFSALPFFLFFLTYWVGNYLSTPLLKFFYLLHYWIEVKSIFPARCQKLKNDYKTSKRRTYINYFYRLVIKKKLQGVSAFHICTCRHHPSLLFIPLFLAWHFRPPSPVVSFFLTYILYFVPFIQVFNSTLFFFSLVILFNMGMFYISFERGYLLFLCTSFLYGVEFLEFICRIYISP